MENFDELEKAMNVKTEIVKETKSVKVKPVKNEGDDPQKDYVISALNITSHLGGVLDSTASGAL